MMTAALIHDAPSTRMETAIALILLGLAGCVGNRAAAQLAASMPAAGGDGLPFVDPHFLDPGIPAPESVIGHPVGEGAVRYADLERYLRILADASAYVTLTPYGTTHEGRPLYFLTVTSRENHARLEDIRQDNAKLADPRLLTDAQQAEHILDTLPGIAWLAYSIHGDELSGADAAIQLVYQLAAGTDPLTRRMRDELVIHIDPLMNPDGRERYLGQLDHLGGKVPNPDPQAMAHTGLWSAGRGNHYLFDLNRDWVALTQPETRGRAAHILSWNPHLVVDAHEMGPTDTYLFDPPREPFNVELAPHSLPWRRRFSSDQAQAFDKMGWSYYTREWYEEWYPGYTNAWANLHGAVGILYEQAGVDGTLVRRGAGDVLTYRGAVHRQLTSSLANLTTLLHTRRELIEQFYNDRRAAVEENGFGGRAAGMRPILLIAPFRDGSRQRTLQDILERQKISAARAKAPFVARDAVDIWGNRLEQTSMPEGTLVVHSAQPHRRFLHALFGFDPPMSLSFLQEERAELENRKPTRIYDVTAWNIGMAFGAKACWAREMDSVELDSVSPPQAPPVPSGTDKAGYGYLIHGADADVYKAAIRLLERNCRVRVAEKPCVFGGTSYPPGSLLLRNHENDPDYHERIRDALEGLFVQADAMNTALAEQGPDLGGSRFRLLHAPRVAIVSQWPASTTSFGSIWHLLDERLHLRVSPINIQSLGRLDLRKYNVLIVPNSYGPRNLTGVLTKPVLARLKQWVESGGTLIAVGASAAFVADPTHELSGVRLRRDVLEQLDDYLRETKRERQARRISVDWNAIWDRPADSKRDEPPGKEQGNGDQNQESTSEVKDAPPKPDDARKDGERNELKPDRNQLRREDEWKRMFSPPGAILAAEVDPSHWLTFGLCGEEDAQSCYLPVLYSGSYVFLSRHPVATPVRLMSDQPQTETESIAGAEDSTDRPRRLRLSGLVWPEARERLSDGAYATVERVGYGQVILFAGEPAFRAYFDAGARLLLNAVLLGPGIGASQSDPW